jgi:hypothetical protein
VTIERGHSINQLQWVFNQSLAMALGHWGRGNRSNCNSNGATGATRGNGIGAMATIDHCHCNRSIGCGGPWGANTIEFNSMCFIRNVSECKNEGANKGVTY